MKRILTYLMSLIFISGLIAQEVNITGKVTDANTGESLPGVNIVVVGTTTGAVTDLDGAYSIAASQGSTLSYSFIGYLEESVVVGTQTVIDVRLSPDLTELEEVVVVGYGQLNKSDLTGSVTSVNVDDVGESGIVTVNELLQGRAAGVDVKTNSGVPGGAVSINIRGVGSMSASTQPLYVIDGVVIAQDDDDFNEEDITPSNPMAFLSPNDIESIEILKDASATAIYGSRGANGVVLIQTKKGKEGKSVVQYSGSVAFSRIARTLDVLDGPDFARYVNAHSIAESGDSNAIVIEYPDSVYSVDWQDEFFKTGISHNHRLSISGGENGSNYYVALGYLNTTGIIEVTGFDKYDFRTNVTKKVNDRVTLGTNIMGAFIENRMTTSTDFLASDRSLMGTIIRYRPIINSSELDSLNELDVELLPANNPYEWIESYTDKTLEKTLNSKFKLDVKLFDWLSYNSSFGLTYRTKERRRFWGKELNKSNEIGLGSTQTSENMHYVFDNMLQFKKKMNDHRFNATLGVTYDKKISMNERMEATGFLDEVSKADAMDGTTGQTLLEMAREDITYASGLFRVNYNYRAFSTTVTGRMDGSSKFTEGNRWGFFPSFAAAYKLHQLSYIKNIETISNLKLRAGWGQVGNSSTDAFATKNIVDYGVTYGNDLPINILDLKTRGNPDLTWETSEQTNIGLDLGLFRNRITLSADAYHKITKDQLQNIKLGAIVGYETMWINLGEVQNQGIELELNTVVLDGDFKTSIGGNIAFNKNKILDVGYSKDTSYTFDAAFYFGDNIGDNSRTRSPINAYMVNQPVGIFVGYKTDGLTTDTTDMFGYRDIEPGNLKIVDANGDGIIDNLDLSIIGDPNPDFIYGFYLNFGYKDIGLDFLFQGSYGAEIFNINNEVLKNPQKTNKAKLREVYEEAWTPDNPDAKYPRLDMNEFLIDNALFTDRWVSDASYLKLSNVTLSYDLKLPKVPVIGSIKLYATANNLFTLTKYEGYDPEMINNNSKKLKTGIDHNSFPAAKTYVFGINVNFK